MDKTFLRRINELADDLERLTRVLDGDPQTDLVGLRKRVRTLENDFSMFMKEWLRIKWILYGVGVGVGAAQASVLGVVIKILTVISGE